MFVGPCLPAGICSNVNGLDICFVWVSAKLGGIGGARISTFHNLWLLSGVWTRSKTTVFVYIAVCCLQGILPDWSKGKQQETRQLLFRPSFLVGLEKSR